MLHRAAYAALGLSEWTYDRVELQAGQLGGWLSELADNWRGVSVTMPLKREALACADTASELASGLRAANTLIRSPQGWHADNTDVAGLSGAVTELDAAAELRGDSVAGPGSASVVGAGGTAAAAIAALAEFGYDHVGIVLRNPARGRELVTLAERLGMTSELHPWPGTCSEESALSCDLVISTVPAAATGDLLDHAWRAGQFVVDVTYDPWPTALVEAAIGQGARAVGGASVLLWQAVAQVELLTGRSAPVEAMRAALLPGGTLAPA